MTKYTAASYYWSVDLPAQNIMSQQKQQENFVLKPKNVACGFTLKVICMYTLFKISWRRLPLT